MSVFSWVNVDVFWTLNICGYFNFQNPNDAINNTGENMAS